MSVYFILNKKNGSVKIGYSGDVQGRFPHIQTGSVESLTLVRVIEGDRETEKWIHTRFRLLHERGEWFVFTPEMLTFLAPSVAAIGEDIAYCLDGIAIRERSMEVKEIVLGLLHKHFKDANTDVSIASAYKYVQARLWIALRKFGLIAEPERNGQAVLPGWQHLRAGYVIKWCNVRRILSAEDMSSAEVLAKAEEYRMMGQGCFAHADELDKYREARNAV